MDLVSYLREQLRAAHDFLEVTVGDVTSEQLHFGPEGHALPVGAAYAHVIYSEDMLVQGMLKRSAPIFAGLKGGMGTSEPMPGFDADTWAGYEAWTRRVKIDLPSLREYAQKVYAASDAWLATLTDADLDAPVDLTAFGLGEQTMAWFIGRIIIAHVDNLTGEISAAKGLQGLKGYPV
jgi:hypothetical protein